MARHRVLVIATSRYTRGGITSVINAHEQGKQWDEYGCKWIETVRDGNAFIKILYFIKALGQFLMLLYGAKILHVHSALGTSIKRKNIFITIGKIFNKKVIIHFHAAEKSMLNNPDKNIIYSKIFKKADKIIVLSDSWKKLLVSKLSLDKDRIITIYNPAPLVERSFIKKNIVLFAGTLIKRKGYDTLIKAFSTICQRSEVNDWYLVMAGNGEVDEAKELISDLGISDRVTLVGWVTGKVKEDLFREASIFCLPSQAEGFPMAILDAWAYGIPCIMTPVGGIPELVTDEVDGIIVPVNNYLKLADALLMLMKSKDIRDKIVKNTDKRISSDFNINILNSQIGNIYQDLIEGK